MAGQCRDVETGQSLAHENDIEFQEDNDYTPMDDDTEAHGSRSTPGKGGKEVQDEEMESDADDADEESDDEEEDDL